MFWPPAATEAPPSASASGSGAQASAASSQPVVPATPSAAFPPAVSEWLDANKDDVTLGASLASVLALGPRFPDDVLTQLGYFSISLLLGHITVSGVAPALHTPLISVTNAISGIIVVGGMLELSGPISSPRNACALTAVFLSSINIVGGFAVTQRMLEMFREDTLRRGAGNGRSAPAGSARRAADAVGGAES